MGNRYDVVMLVLNDLTHDSRVRREAEALATTWRVLVVGTQRADGALPDRERIANFEVWRIRYGRWGAGLWRPWRWLRHALQAVLIVWALRRVRARVYHAHDLPALLLILSARALWGRGARLVYDAHELHAFMPRSACEHVRGSGAPPAAQARRRAALLRVVRRKAHGGAPTPADVRNAPRLSPARRALFVLEGACARRADAVLSVSAPSARALRLWWRLPRVYRVRNAVDPPGAAAPRDLRTLLDGRRCIVHSGDLTLRGRCLLELIQALALLPHDVALIFLGQGEARDLLVREAARLGVAGRVHFVPPVSPQAVAATVQSCDVAAVLLCPESWHIRSTLPNKLFEALAAGVPVVTSDTFALRRIVRRYELGVLCDPRDPNAIATALRQLLTPEAQAYHRTRIHRAQQRINWTHEAQRLRTIYRELLP